MLRTLFSSLEYWRRKKKSSHFELVDSSCWLLRLFFPLLISRLAAVFVRRVLMAVDVILNRSRPPSPLSNIDVLEKDGTGHFSSCTHILKLLSRKKILKKKRITSFHVCLRAIVCVWRNRAWSTAAWQNKKIVFYQKAIKREGGRLENSSLFRPGNGFSG